MHSFGVRQLELFKSVPLRPFAIKLLLTLMTTLSLRHSPRCSARCDKVAGEAKGERLRWNMVESGSIYKKKHEKTLQQFLYF